MLLLQEICCKEHYILNEYTLDSLFDAIQVGLARLNFGHQSVFDEFFHIC